MSTTSSVPVLKLQDKKNAKILGDTTPALIVEGKTDVNVYRKLLLNSKLDWSKIDIVIGGNKNTIKTEHQKGLPFKYIALLDADYGYYHNNIEEEQQIIYTHFYTLENYLTTEEVIEELLNDFRIIGREDKNAYEIIQNAIESIMPFILACVAKLKENWQIPLEEKGIDRWWDREHSRIKIDDMQSYLEDELSKIDLNLTIDWTKLRIEYNSILERLELDKFVHGKHKLEAIYYQLKQHFPYEMEHRRIHTFKIDLTKYISKCSEAIDLVNKIDDKFTSNIFSDLSSV